MSNYALCEFTKLHGLIFFAPPGPEFQIDTVGSITTPVLERITEKWGKGYKTFHRTELLAYFGVQPIGPAEHWLQDVGSFVSNNWNGAPFQRVWICDLAKPEVLWHLEKPTSM